MSQASAAMVKAMRDDELMIFASISELNAKRLQRQAAKCQSEAAAARKEIKRRKREAKAA